MHAGAIVAWSGSRVRMLNALDRTRSSCIGASTGGVEALKEVLMGLPADCPPILITQHMPPRFTAAFAERLNRECPMTVSEASHDDASSPAMSISRPARITSSLRSQRQQFRVPVVRRTRRCPGHRPSVDVLFPVRGAHRRAHRRSASILTGMGKDGAEGMLELRQAGAITLGQDEASSLIYGMPRAAFERGAVMRQHPLSQMADAILDACGRAQGGIAARAVT